MQTLSVTYHFQFQVQLCLGYLVGATPRGMLKAQIIGSMSAPWWAVGVYALYTSGTSVSVGVVALHIVIVCSLFVVFVNFMLLATKIQVKFVLFITHHITPYHTISHHITPYHTIHITQYSIPTTYFM